METLIFNTALIRRRIRDPKLIMEILSAGNSSHTDIAVCYMEGRVDEELLNNIRKPDPESAGRRVDHEPGESGRGNLPLQMVQPVPKI